MTLKNRKQGIIAVFIIVSTLGIVGCGSNNSSDNSLQTNLQQEFLPVEEAFIFSVKATDSQIIKTHWKIAEGYHLYKDKFKFSIAPANYKIVDINYPEAKVFSDKNLGNLESYAGSVEVTIKITGDPKSEKVSLTSTYQGCADVGLCYPPETRKTDFNLASL